MLYKCTFTNKLIRGIPLKYRSFSQRVFKKETPPPRRAHTSTTLGGFCHQPGSRFSRKTQPSIFGRLCGHAFRVILEWRRMEAQLFRHFGNVAPLSPNIRFPPVFSSPTPFPDSGTLRHVEVFGARLALYFSFRISKATFGGGWGVSFFAKIPKHSPTIRQNTAPKVWILETACSGYRD